MGLNIVHLNAQSLNNKLDEFRYLFVSAGVDIICISESWFPLDINDSIFKLEGFNLYRADRRILVNGVETRAKGGGVAIYVRSDIHTKVKLRTCIGSEIEYLFLEVTTRDKMKLLLGSVYRPHKNIRFDSFVKLLENVTVQYDDIVIIGDFNNNLLINNPLQVLMASLDLNAVNTETPTHFHSSSNSLIDLVFVNHISKVLLYEQLSASVFSNHDVIFLTYDSNVQSDITHVTYRDLRNIDYSLLNLHADNICWSQIYNLVDVNDQLFFIQENVKKLFDLCVPLKTKVIKPNQHPWFSPEINQLIKKRNDAHSRWKKFKTPELQLIFKTARRDVVNSIKLAKSLFYERKFSSAMDSKSKWKEIRKIGISDKSISVCEVDVDVNDLNHKFVNINIQPPTSRFYDDLCTVSIENCFSFRCVNQNEVCESICAVKSKAVGMDDMNPTFLKAITQKILPFLTHLFNSILTKSEFPLGWKLSKIIPIPKQNNDFRPIAILPFLSKVMENIMCKQMNQYLSQQKLLSDFQSGFVKGKSCITALTDVVEDLRSKLDNNMVSFLTLLDHSKAFDTVNHSILLKKLEKFFYFSSSACNLLSSYLTGRSQVVYFNGKNSDELYLNRGVPQGSILGPLLFCLFINDLPNILAHCKVQMYADDVQIYSSTSINDINMCVDNINHDLANVYNWAVINGLCINPLKSKCIFLSKHNRTVIDNIQLKINTDIIEFVDSSKNLGVIFNNKLTWSNHINSVVGRIYGMLRNLWAVKYSTPLKIRMLLAKTYLIPVLLYGCEIYANCDSTDSRKLKVAYNNIARYIYNKSNRVSISAYSYQINQMNFDNLLKFRNLIFLHKIITSKQPIYLYTRIKFARSTRGRKLLQHRFKTLLSQRQFYIYATSLWNLLPNQIQIISNANKFRTELLKYFC